MCAAANACYHRRKPYIPPSIYDVIRVPSLAEMFAFNDMPA